MAYYPRVTAMNLHRDSMPCNNRESHPAVPSTQRFFQIWSINPRQNCFAVPGTYTNPPPKKSWPRDRLRVALALLITVLVSSRKDSNIPASEPRVRSLATDGRGADAMRRNGGTAPPSRCEGNTSNDWLRRNQLKRYETVAIIVHLSIYIK